MFTNTDIYNDIDLLALKMVVVVEKVGLIHIHLLLNCVHKYTNIYDGIGFLVLEGVAVVEGWSTLYPSPSSPELCSHVQILMTL